MKWAATGFLLLLVAAGAWGYSAYRESTLDAVFKRDRLANSGSLVVTFEGEGQFEGYRYTRLGDGKWIWERTLRPTAGEAQPGDTMLWNGKEYLLQLGPGCFASLASVRPPLIPGVTTAKRLKEMDLKHLIPGPDYQYEVEPGDAASPAPLEPVSPVTITEDLRGVDHGEYRAATSGRSIALSYGTYRIVRATPAEVKAAEGRISEARASEVARLEMRVRALSAQFGGVTGPYPLLVAGACPGTPAQLYPASRGGQRPGARWRPPDLPLISGQPGVVAAARAIPAVLLPAPYDVVIARANAETPADTPVKRGQVLVVKGPGTTFLAISIDSCEPASFFPC
ncbi:MAG: hypothetical protein ACKVT1_03325 [Dehalococcoidia bacterium]